MAIIVTLLGGSSAAYGADQSLNTYRVEATPEHLRALAESGFDVTEGRDLKRNTVDVVGTASQIAETKVGARQLTDERAPQRAAANPTAGADDSAYTVWTKYDAVAEPADEEKEQYTEWFDRVVAEHPGLVAKRVTGRTANGREIVALQVTKGATGADIPGRPAVLYNAMQHAREWLAGETCRRTLDYTLDNYGKTTSAGREVTPLVDGNELWFVCVNNPDGYEYTFTPGHRLWRKNLADNNRNGTIEPGDGVDPNRNFSANWGLDDEGSSPDPADETYRGASPASEPETKAMEALFREIHPVFQKNDHTAAELLLYPQGFQQDTPTADDQIFTALAGDPFKPGIEGFLPELSAGLYITNGDFTDWAYSTQKTLSYTPEGTAAEPTAADPDVSVFEYPDSPQQVQQEFRRHLPFALDLAKSAADPSEPVSHLGNTAADFDVQTFAQSYGDPQAVQATVKRKLGDVTLRFRVNGGPIRQASTREFAGGERYFKNDAVYYHRVRGFVTGTSPGDTVEAWFEAAGKTSGHFSYRAVVETANPVLLLSDEDWSGKQPNPQPLAGPQYLDTYKRLLDAAGIAYDVYDVSATRTAPDNLGVLSHYSHVVWYTGDDFLTREPGAGPGTGMSKLAVDVQNRVRDFLNEGGKLFYTGQNAGAQFAALTLYNPFQAEEGEFCPPAGTSSSCIASQDDFLQYYLGANTYVAGGGSDPQGMAYPVSGFAAPFDSGPFALDPKSSTASLLVTSSLYDPVRYPQFAGSKKAMSFVRPGASPYDPFTGSWFAAAGATNAAYKRLLRPVDLRGKTSATLSFQTSFDLEADYDYTFVEIHTQGADDWTTLKEKKGLNAQDVGLSCPATGDGSNWQSLHPFLAHYQTKTNAGADCTPRGTSGEWWAATGNSGGWKLFDFDLPARYLGKQVEIAITTATDPASLGLGHWVDDTKLVTNTGTAFSTSFEGGLDGWTTPAPPAGTEVRGPTWTRARSAPFVEGSATSTPDTVFTGFGLEKVQSAAGRQAILRDVFEHLGAPSKPVFDVPAPVTGAGGSAPAGGGTAPGTRPGSTPASGTKRINGLALFRLGRQRLADVRRRGVRLTVLCPGGCPLVVELRVDRPTRRALKLKSDRIGRARLTVKNGRRSFRVKLTKTALKAIRRRKSLRIVVTAVVPGATTNGRRIASLRLR